MRQVKNKKGFTLTEIMLVIAIIVILAGAVTVGLVVDYHKYNNYLKSLQGFKCVDCGYEYVDRNNPDSHPAACPKCGGGNWEKNSDGYWEYDARDWVSGIFERSANEAQVLRESIEASMSESRASREAVEASIRASQEESRRIEESERLARESDDTSTESTGDTNNNNNNNNNNQQGSTTNVSASGTSIQLGSWGHPVATYRVDVTPNDNYKTITVVVKFNQPVYQVDMYNNRTATISADGMTVTYTGTYDKNNSNYTFVGHSQNGYSLSDCTVVSITAGT